jgi:replicative DNA helicase
MAQGIEQESLLRQLREQAEHHLLGALLIRGAFDPQGDEIREVSELIVPKDFSDYQRDPPHNQHFRIFVAMQTLASQGKSINQVTVAQKLYETIDQSHGGDKSNCDVSDIAEMCGMVSECECSLEYMEYATAIRQYSLKRTIDYLTSKGELDKVAELLRRRHVEAKSFTVPIAPRG